MCIIKHNEKDIEIYITKQLEGNIYDFTDEKPERKNTGV